MNDIDLVTAIVLTGGMIMIGLGCGGPVTYDYHTELKNIAYQLSRIADALREASND